MKRLGVDLGTNSLGWAVFDDDELIKSSGRLENSNPIRCGVVVFQEGFDRDKSENLKSPAAERRARRAARRLIFRRRLRKFHMLRALMDLGMCPLSEEGFTAWKEKGIYPLADTAFIEWLKSTPEHNPYADRAMAAEQKVDPLTLGRALYHLAQRRGFKSSRKERVQELQAEEESANPQKKNSSSKKESKDELGVVKQGIKKLTENLDRNNFTLGQYFFWLFSAYTTALKENRMKEAGELERIRGQRTGRKEHYEKEFDRIAEVQGLAKETRDHLRSILFFQRPLRIQRHLVGWCSLEKGRPYRVKDAKGNIVVAQGHKYRRCLEGHPDYERFRALSFLNNLRVVVSQEQNDENERLRRGEGRALTPEEREIFLKGCVRKTSWKVEDALSKLFGKKARIRTNYRLGDDAPIMPVCKSLEDLGIERDLWKRAINALYDFDDVDKLINWAQKSVAEHGLGLEEKEARRFACIDASQDRAAYSLHAIRKILPFLEKGFLLRKAIFCAKLPDFIPDFKEHEDELLEGLSACEAAWEEERAVANSDPLHRRKTRPLESGHYRTYLRERWNLDDSVFEQLYVDTAQPDGENPVLPPVDLNAIRNPLVNRSLTVLRRLVNTLRREGTIDKDTQIFIELARNVNNANACRAIEKWQEKRRDARKRARAFLKKNENDETLILKHILWEEQKQRSVYTGQPLPQESITSADYEIEHTIPRSRGGTSELWNLTLCERHYNVDIKGGRLPTECPNANCEWRDSARPETPYPALSLSAPIVAWKEELASLDAKLKKKPARGGDPAVYAKKRQEWLLTKLERDYLAKKLRAFTITSKELEEQDFIPRQLADTGIMTKYAVRFLKTRYKKVFARNGAATATARKLWGIQQEGEEKSRASHIHHAVDACVIAALDQATFTMICTQLKQDGLGDTWERTLPPPIPDFATCVHQAAQSILVRHLSKNRQGHPIGKKRTRLSEAVLHRLQKEGRSIPHPGKSDVVRGSLHNDTLYGRIFMDGEEKTVLRKGLEEILENIVKKDSKKKSKENAEKGNKEDGPTKEKIQAILQKIVVDKGLVKVLAKQITDYIQARVSTKDLAKQSFFAPNGLPVKSVRIYCDKPKNPDAIRVPNPELPPSYGSGSDALYLSVRKKAKSKKFESVFVNLIQSVKDPASVVSPDEKYRIYPDQLALAYEKDPAELRSLTPQQLSKRLYVVTQVEEIGSKVILRFHQDARKTEDVKKERKDTELSKYASEIDYKSGTSILRLSPGTYFEHLLFENVHFRLTLDGRIEWLQEGDHA